jgi:hypothetical protein
MARTGKYRLELHDNFGHIFFLAGLLLKMVNRTNLPVNEPPPVTEGLPNRKGQKWAIEKGFDQRRCTFGVCCLALEQFPDYGDNGMLHMKMHLMESGMWLQVRRLMEDLLSILEKNSYWQCATCLFKIGAPFGFSKV